MRIGSNEIDEIQVTADDGTLIVSITDNDVIGMSGYKVELVKYPPKSKRQDKNDARPRRIDSAKVIRAIETRIFRREGKEDPYRAVTQFRDFRGNFWLDMI